MRSQLITLGSVVTLIGFFSPVWAGKILVEFPEDIEAGSKYVIYSHGRIVEGDNPMPVHERWGVYDFPSIKETLAEGHDSILIAHHRPANTDVDSYVKDLTSWVLRLTRNGVNARDITLVGFSRGGQITARVSSALKPLPINTALLATCWAGGVLDIRDIVLEGRLLSIYETSDFAQSCKELADRSAGLSSFQEIAISTGKEHGAFYTPLPDWIDPLTAWIRQVPGN